jgi:hypothetical protein
MHFGCSCVLVDLFALSIGVYNNIILYVFVLRTNIKRYADDVDIGHHHHHMPTSTVYVGLQYVQYCNLALLVKNV